MSIKPYLFIPVILALFGTITLFGQDIHLSHIHASPTYLNPAMTGIFNGQVRTIANAKSQWNAFNNGYKTMIASADMRIHAIDKLNFVSGGIQISSDKAGDLDFNNTSAALSLAYLKSFDRDGDIQVSFGGQIGYVSTSVDFTKIDSHQTIDFADAYMNSRKFVNFSAGVATFIRSDNDNLYYGGISFFQLNNPNISFNNREYIQDLTLSKKINVHAGATIGISKNADFKPSFLYSKQGPHSELLVGGFLKFNPSKTKRRGKTLHSLYLGAWMRHSIASTYRTTDAVIASVRVDYRNTQINFSYDINISSYANASMGLGGLELSFINIFDWQPSSRRKLKVRCPEF